MKSLPRSLSPTGPHGLIIFEKELLGIAIKWKVLEGRWQAEDELRIKHVCGKAGGRGQAEDASSFQM